MMVSLRARLTVAILGVAGIAAAVLAALLYAAVAAVLWADFDQGLRDTATIFAEILEWDPDDGYELEGGQAIARHLAEGPHPRHVSVVVSGGEPLLLGDVPVSRATMEDTARRVEEGAVFELAEGAIRGVRVVVAVRGEGAAAPGPVEIVVAGDTAGVRDSLAQIATWCWLLAVGTIALAAVASQLAARRGLAPVRRLARALDRIREPEDALALSVDEVPAELRGVVGKLDALLVRLREAFVRERRFVADASHELRTPVAVVRTAIDVALQGEHSPTEYRRRLQDLRDGTARLAATLDSLLLLTRATAGQVALRHVALPICALVEECWAPFAAAARRRDLTFVNAFEVDMVLEADESTLRMILANLLSNACEYTETGGTIRVGPGTTPGVLLAVHDTGPPIAEGSLQHVFEPFWRADSARSEAGLHCGIGLSLARALARCQGFELTLENTNNGGVVAALHRLSRDSPVAR